MAIFNCYVSSPEGISPTKKPSYPHHCIPVLVKSACFDGEVPPPDPPEVGSHIDVKGSCDGQPLVARSTLNLSSHCLRFQVVMKKPGDDQRFIGKLRFPTSGFGDTNPHVGDAFVLEKKKAS